MKKKSIKIIKKTLKNHLLFSSINNARFLIIQLKAAVNFVFLETKKNKLSIDSFSKQSFNTLTFLNSNVLKFPNILISVFALKDTLDYCIVLLKEKFLSSLFLLKIYFLFFKKFKNLPHYMFSNILQINMFLTFFLISFFNKTTVNKSHKLNFPAFIEYKLNFI